MILRLFIAAAAIGSVSATQAAVVTFQQGVGGYTGTVDTTISAANPGTPQPATDAFAIRVSGPNNGAGEQQGLIRFDDIFGGGPNQIGAGATINSATLSLNKLSGFGNVEAWELTTSFDESSTWNSLGNGIQRTGGMETTGSAIDSQNFGGGGDGLFRDYDVTSSLINWAANPALNEGWGLLMSFSNAGAAANIRSSQNSTAASTPILTVDFTPAAIPEPSSLGVLATLIGGCVVTRRRRR